MYANIFHFLNLHFFLEFFIITRFLHTNHDVDLKSHRAGGVAQVAYYLPIMYEAVGLIFSIKPGLMAHTYNHSTWDLELKLTLSFRVN